ncbi:unnamed protein product [Adineta steineri]|uniref:Purinergic receptor n=1 Tax=Adineta steineri TaxID=433720 RepID=A0A813RCU9_9BILA|nr:unnamed protein product [Adineta steineri]
MISFTLLKKNLRNIQDDTDFRCRFDGTSKTSDCPIIPISYILDRLNTNKTALLLEGGLIEIRQDWICNFDVNPKKCTPKYDFSLLQSGDDKQSPGINYRFAQKYRENGVDYRTLTKVYGLRFVVSITGKGGQFNIVNLFLAIGSGIGFMVIAGIVCDAILIRNIQDDTDFKCRFDGTSRTSDCPIIPISYILDRLNTNKTALLLEVNFAQKYREDGVDYRTLTKVYGLRFVVSITGKGGQFNIVNLFLAIGSGIGFMVIAGIVCDAILMYVHRSRETYRRGKFSICEVDNDGMRAQILEHSHA